jgi:SAM-dependent methyltransferase
VHLFRKDPRGRRKQHPSRGKKTDTREAAIEYRLCAIEDLDFPSGEFDAVMSSLALHYVDVFDVVCRRIAHWLNQGGTFVFSVEHPIFTAIAAPQWCLGPSGEQLYWPVCGYRREVGRRTEWLLGSVIHYHRTIANYVDTRTEAGFSITKLLEPTPSAELLAAGPRSRDGAARGPQVD